MIDLYDIIINIKELKDDENTIKIGTMGTVLEKFKDIDDTYYIIEFEGEILFYDVPSSSIKLLKKLSN